MIKGIEFLFCHEAPLKIKFTSLTFPPSTKTLELTTPKASKFPI